MEDVWQNHQPYEGDARDQADSKFRGCHREVELNEDLSRVRECVHKWNMITLLFYAFAIICFTLLPVVLHMVATKRPSTCLTGRGARNIIHSNIEFFRLIRITFVYQVETGQGELAGLVSAIVIPTLIDFSNIRTMSKTHRASVHTRTHAHTHTHARTAQNKQTLKQWRGKCT